MSELSKKQPLLLFLYRTFDLYIKNNYHTACNRGCSSCCTQNVTLTTLEGYQVLKGLKKNESTRNLNCLAAPDPSRFRPRFTINDLAFACLNREEPPDEETGSDLKVCLLLQDDFCSIYDDRPFACRSFVSQKACLLTGEAEVSPGLVSVIAACQQIIEHMDVNGHYGNIADIVRFLNSGNKKKYAGGNRLNAADLSPTKPIPGFLIPPDDAAEVRTFLSRLFHGNIDGEPFYKRLVSLCPMPVNSN
jgi:Fe-S-cluster containining protein